MMGDVLEVMKELAREGMTMIAVTHEMSFAREVADRVVMMDEGRIIEDTDPIQFFTAPAFDRSKPYSRACFDRSPGVASGFDPEQSSGTA